MATRAQVNVFNVEGKQKGQTAMPSCSRRNCPDVVNFVHTIAKNKRQAYSVNRLAGHQTSAESWVQAALLRVFRVLLVAVRTVPDKPLSGICAVVVACLHQRASGAWHRRVAVGQGRYATCSALAASALPSLMWHGT